MNEYVVAVADNGGNRFYRFSFFYDHNYPKAFILTFAKDLL